MIQPRRAIEFGDNRRQLDANPPLVSPATGALERVAPAVPPARDAAGERLDDQHAIAVRARSTSRASNGSRAVSVSSFSVNAARMAARPFGNVTVAMSR